MKHYFLIAKDVGDLTAILCAALEEQSGQERAGLGRMIREVQAAQGPEPAAANPTISSSTTIASTSPTGGVSARPGQPDPHLPPRAEAQSRLSPRRDARGDALAQADRPQDAGGRGGQPAVPRNPDLGQRSGNRAAADERGRRARRLRPGLRPRRRDDAVQHVPPLHGGRASAALHRRCSPTSSAAATRNTASPTN